MTAFPAHRRDPGPVPPGAALAPPAARVPPGPVITTLTTTTDQPAPADPPATPRGGPAGGQVPKLRVTVARLGPDGSRQERSAVDTERISTEDGHQLHALVDAVEAAGPPAGSTFGLILRPAGSIPKYEVTVARGFGHWTVTVPVGVKGTALATLIEHVRGVPGGN